MCERLGRENLDGPQIFFPKDRMGVCARNLITNRSFALCSALAFRFRSAIAPGHSLAAAETV